MTQYINLYIPFTSILNHCAFLFLIWQPLIFVCPGPQRSRRPWRVRSIPCCLAWVVTGLRCRGPWTAGPRTNGDTKHLNSLYILLSKYRYGSLWHCIYLMIINYKNGSWIHIGYYLMITMTHTNDLLGANQIRYDPFCWRTQSWESALRMPKKVSIFLISRWSQSLAKKGRLAIQILPLLRRSSSAVWHWPFGWYKCSSSSNRNIFNHLQSQFNFIFPGPVCFDFGYSHSEAFSQAVWIHADCGLALACQDMG